VVLGRSPVERTEQNRTERIIKVIEVQILKYEFFKAN
jgi:hypothetical protein